MNVTSEQYRDFVSKLFFRNPGDLSKDFAHAVMGITTEAFELGKANENDDKVNRLEEAGDLMFFATAGCMVISEYLQQANLVGGQQRQLRETQASASPTVALTPIVAEISSIIVEQIEAHTEETTGESASLYFITRLQDIAKKWVGYGNAPNADEALEACTAMISCVFYALWDEGEGENESTSEVAQRVAQANIRKLQHRYPGGFNLDKAQNRDLKGERDALQAG